MTVDEVERCSCDEALALRAELDATAELVKAVRSIPRESLDWWARHGGEVWQPFGRAALAVLDRKR